MAFGSRVHGGLLRSIISPSSLTHVPRVGGLPNGFRSFSILQRTNSLQPFSRPIWPTQNYTSPLLLARTYAVVPTPPPNPKPEEIAASATTPTEPISSSIIDPALPTVDQAIPVVDSLPPVDLISNTLAQSLQPGELAALGYTGWTPAGFVRWFFEIFHFGAGLPYFYSILATALLIRVMLTPVMAMGQRNTAKLQALQPQMEAIQRDFKHLKNHPNPLERQRLALKQAELYSTTGVNPLKALVSPMIQLPMNFGMFFGFRALFGDKIPGMNTYSGFEWLPDLTATTPYALPVVMMGLMIALLTVQSREMNLRIRPDQGHILNIFRGLTIVGAIVMQTFSAGLITGLMATNILTIFQCWMMQQPAVRRRLNIPAIKLEDQAPLPSFKESINWIQGKSESGWLNGLEGIRQGMAPGGGSGSKNVVDASVTSSVNSIKKPTIQLPKMVAPKPVKPAAKKGSSGKKARA